MGTFEKFFVATRPPSAEELAEKQRIEDARVLEVALMKKRETPYSGYALKNIKPEAFSLHPTEKFGDVEGVIMLTKGVGFIAKEPDYFEHQTFVWDENSLSFSLKKAGGTIEKYSLTVSRELPKKATVKREQDGKVVDIVFSDSGVTFDISKFQVLLPQTEQKPVVTTSLEPVGKKIKKPLLEVREKQAGVVASIISPSPKPSKNVVEMLKGLFQ